MTLTRWQRPNLWSGSTTPTRRVATLQDDIDNLFNLAFSRFLGATADTNGGAQLLGSWFPVVDVYEDKDSLVVRAEVPGMKKEDIEISLQDGFLTFSGERKEEHKQETAETYRSERVLGRFHRSISLPCQVVAEKIKATYTDGVLTVTLPKAEEAKPKQIPITVK
jgi:HSP20 family protein